MQRPYGGIEGGCNLVSGIAIVEYVSTNWIPVTAARHSH